MSVIDVLEFLIDPELVIRLWRFWLCLAFGVGAGYLSYKASAGSPSAAAVAFGAGVLGAIIGGIWQAASRSRT